MTTRTMSPGELHQMLESRVEKARPKRRAERNAFGFGGFHKKATTAVVAAGILVIGMATMASGAPFYIDLTQAGNSETDANGGVWVQGTGGAGTGNFDPFLTMQSTPSETGVNVCDDAGCPPPQFDTTGVPAGRTHELLASAIPVVTDPGDLTGDYRVFSLDSNDTGSDDWVSVDAVKIFLSTDVNQTYPVGGDPIYELPDDTHVLLRSQALSAGSGESDLTLFVPNSVFPADCYYGSTTCNQYVWFYTEIGYAGNVEVDGVTHDFSTNAGFEEWRVQLQPVVDIQKTVDVSFDRTYPWDVQKQANVDTINLFAGDTASIDWTVKVLGGEPQDTNASVSGDINILNPTGTGYAIQDGIDAVITDVQDVMTLGGVPQSVTVDCPQTFPYTLDPGDTLTCTYSATPSSTQDGTNTATATIITDPGSPHAHPPIPPTTQEYSDTEPVSFSGVTPNEIDKCIDVTDDNATPGDTGDDLTLGTVCRDDLVGGEYTFSPFSTNVGPFDVGDCGSTTVTNTAYTETSDTATTDSADDSVDVNCYVLSVDKTADTSLTRTWSWDVSKSANVDSIDLFAGDSASIDWTVVVTSLGSSDSAFHVSGDITIHNPAPMEATGVAVSDAISGFAGTVTVDCDAGTLGNQVTVDVPAKSGGVDGEATCSYSADLPDGSTRTNTGKATLFSIDYTGTHSVDFSSATLNEVDTCINVTDDNATPGDTTDDIDLGQVCLSDLDSNDQYTFDKFSTTVGPFDIGDCKQTTVKNTAYTKTEDLEVTDSADASVDVDCYQLTVSKDATTTYQRDFNWDISKERTIVAAENDGDGDPLTLTLSPGQVYTVTYEVKVGLDSTTAYTDSNWAVSGTITIENPAPMEATGVSVSDLITKAGDSDIAATVDCDPGTLGNQTTVDVPAASGGTNGEATCSYSATLPNADSRTNTATATLFGKDYTGNADVTFGDPTTLVDECVNVTDDKGTADTSDDVTLGQVCYNDTLPATFTYTTDIGPYDVCGEHTFTNIATYLAVDDANDTGETDSATYTVTIDVPCPSGCTLTQGYWKTHNESFPGGAPADDTWLMLASAENTTFFNSGDTWYGVFWTAPKGNAYYNLAHQYMAAQLNIWAGADPSAIQTEFDAATALFEAYTPADIGALRGNNALRKQFIYLAGVLGDYNEGLIGPGHCDDDGQDAAVQSTSLKAGVVFLPPIGLLVPIAEFVRRRRNKR